MMDAETVARVMSLIPDRTPRLAVGARFSLPQTEQIAYLAKFLNWLSPLSPITKDDQRALGLLQAHQRPAVEADEEPDLDEETLGAGAGEDGLEEHVAPGGEVFRPGALDLVVADPALAGHEDHRGGGDARHVDGVVAGAADDIAVR